VFVRDLNLPGVRAQDGRRIEVIANGLPMYHGAQIAIDATIVSPVRADGFPIAGAASQDGVALQVARGRKLRQYQELTRSRRCKLLVAAVEVGGRWHPEAYQFLRQMALSKARCAPRPLRAALTASWLRRWTGMIAFAVHDAYAASLVEETPVDTTATDGLPPCMGEVLLAA